MPQRVAAQAEATAHYSAGWNIVAAPTGTVLAEAVGPAYALGPGSTDYLAVGAGEVIGGRALWVYFPHDVTVTLEKTAAEYTRVIAPPEQLLLAGNPGTSEAVRIAGADVAYSYDPLQGYTQVAELAPGHGAFVLSHSGGDITLGKPPTGPAADEVRRLQAALTANPTDRTNVDQLGSVAAELVRGRQYADVQAVLDDLRAAEEDGLHQQGSGLLPPLSDLQHDSFVAVREAVARAKAAAATGDLTKADAEIAAARQAALAAQNDGVEAAKAAGTGMLAYDGMGRPRQATANLAGFGALVRSAFFATGLGQPPADPFWELATTVLASPPLVVPAPAPPASVPPPPPPPATATACANGCTFSGEGTSTLTFQNNGKPITISSSFTFQITVANGRVAGQGQTTTSYPATGGDGCTVATQTGTVNVSGSLSASTLHLSIPTVPPAGKLVCPQITVDNVWNTFYGTDIYFAPVDVEARDGASGSAGGVPTRSDFTASMQVTLHGGQ